MNPNHMKLHHIRLESQFVEDVRSGKKTFDIRENDRGYYVGDLIKFCDGEGKELELPLYKITYLITKKEFYVIPDKWCVFSIEVFKGS